MKKLSPAEFIKAFGQDLPQTSVNLAPANPIVTDTRHYCHFCKRKREERFMRKWFKVAWGKRSWICSDDTAKCRAIQNSKRGRQ